MNQREGGRILEEMDEIKNKPYFHKDLPNVTVHFSGFFVMNDGKGSLVS